jgi:inhibitor of cysteine peptidase
MHLKNLFMQSKNLRLLNKWLSVGLLGLLLLANGSASLALSPLPSTFRDVPEGHPNFAAIQYLKSMNIVEGYEGLKFKPDAEINRAEFLKLLLEFKNKEQALPAGKSCYPDVKANDWFAKYVCFATEKGYVAGYPDGNFGPGKSINFVEAAKMVAQVFELELKEGTGNYWFEKYVKALEAKKAIPGEIQAFDQNLARAQMAEIAWRLLTKRETETTNTFENITKSKTAFDTVSPDYKNFASCTELKTYLLEASEKANDERVYLFKSVEGGRMEAVDAQTESTGDSAPTSSVANEAATDFSSTNVQVEGVDEADIVKNDGQYIYILKGGSIRIVKAYPAKDMRELSAFDFADKNFTPSDMYLDGDKVVVIGRSYEIAVSGYNQPTTSDQAINSKIAIYPPFNPTKSLTKVVIINTENKEKPVSERTVTVEGDLNTTRKIGDHVYVVSNQGNYGFGILRSDTKAEPVSLLPEFSDTSDTSAKSVAGCGDVLYHPGGTAANYTVISAIPLSKSGKVENETILGYSGQVYASKRNLYFAESTNNWYSYYPAPTKTYIHKFNLIGNRINYKGNGIVEGDIFNQFAMDEYNGYFRVVTHNYGTSWWNGSEAVGEKSKSQLFVLDENMKQVGKLSDLGVNEDLHGVRFAGEKAYVVTFKKIDPLFVIGLADPQNPKVLGELKIPGFSDYLHPLDQNHIIGFGLDTEESVTNENFAWYHGVKLAIFDVTDVNNPKELHKLIIGDRGTSTPVSYNHKALLFAPGKGANGKALMAIPVSLHELTAAQKEAQKTEFPPYGEQTGQFAFVYDVSVKDGFELKGKLSHFQNVSEPDSYQKHINRIVYLGEYLYTISDKVVMANLINNLKNEIKKIELAKRDDEPEYYPWVY